MRSASARPYARKRLSSGKTALLASLQQQAEARAGRQFPYRVARLTEWGGAIEASVVKAYVCRAAEWVTREAIHGGMVYAEEFPVSRYYRDTPVLSIFEGADEILALKVVARRLAR